MSDVVKIKPIHELFRMPKKAHSTDAGFDLVYVYEDPVVLAPGARDIFDCGFSMQLPKGYEGQVRPRSGLAAKHGITVLNAPGTIDADYTGPIRVVLINTSQEEYTVRGGDRIAQLIIQKLPDVVFEQVDDLDVTDRGAGGFGSTGR